MFFNSSEGLDFSLSTQILISFIIEVFCACLKSGVRVNKTISPLEVKISDWKKT